MRWATQHKDKLAVQLERDQNAEKYCLDNGLIVSYRYEFKLCRKRSWWLDSCTEPRIEVHNLKFEPISESYTVETDKLGDADRAQESLSLSAEEAFDEVIHTEIEPSSFALPRSQSTRPQYLQARVRYTCKGDRSAVIDRISNVISLGLVGLGTAESGWIDFNLGTNRVN